MESGETRTYRAVLLDTCRRTIHFLDEHGIRYFAEGGTLLGAARHGGMIPWDDDVDLNVPREDLNRLLSLRPALNEIGLDILSLDIPGYYQPFAKIINLQTSVWENKSIPFMSGVWVDLFPLDYYDAGAQAYLPVYRRFKRAFLSFANGLHHYSFGDLFRPLGSMDLQSFFRQWGHVLYYKPMHNRFKDCFLSIERQMTSVAAGANCISLTEKGAYVMDASWFSESVVLPFEDFELKVPVGYREYLRFMFGDYMKLPDQPFRKSDHEMYFVDLNRRVSIEQARAIKSGKIAQNQ